MSMPVTSIGRRNEIESDGFYPQSTESGFVNSCHGQYQHVKVFYRPGFFAGWPANHGVWAWGDELLVGLALARHADKSGGHTYDPGTARLHFARSLDGGRHWTLEPGEAAGIRGPGQDHLPPAAAAPAMECPGGIDFIHPDFALTFLRMNNHTGPSHFYYSFNRGKAWRGPFLFPALDGAGFVNRTEYFVEGAHALLAFVTAAKPDGLEGRAGCARTSDGGRCWRMAGWIGPTPPPGAGNFAIMPAAARLSDGGWLAMLRRKSASGFGLTAYRSDANAISWRAVPTPDLGNLRGQCGEKIHNPPALIKLKDGRLCLAYGVRSEPACMCVRVSGDEGLTWSDAITVRGDDGANFDMGYPRLAQRPDGKIVLIYYYNNALLSGAAPYRYLAATIFDV